MSEEMRTADQFMQAVNAMKNALDTKGIEKNLDLEIAARHNIRRKMRMIKSMKGLYRYLHGNGPKPNMLPSVEFNPFEGPDRTNIHYMIKTMSACPPWDLQKDVLVAPTAITLLMVEAASKLFPCPQVFRLTLLVQEFVNRWTLPKLRPEWDEAELNHQIEKYKADMEKFEERFKSAFAEMSVYFGGIERPERNPVVKKIDETHKRTKKLSEKLCPSEENASFVAQEKALAIWNEYRNNTEVKMRYCKPRHRITYADVFDYCKRSLIDLGFMSAAAFEKAVKARNKRSSRGTK